MSDRPKIEGPTYLSTTLQTIDLPERGDAALLEADGEVAVPLFPLATQFSMTHPSGDRAVRVLLVEDNPADVRLTREALEDGDDIELAVVADGEAAMAYLRSEGAYENTPRPQLVLLDLNLPKKDGREVLEELKSDTALSRIPVVVLTTSAAETDIARSYELHANCFITKPLDLDEYFVAMRNLKSFWLSSARLPS